MFNRFFLGSHCSALRTQSDCPPRRPAVYSVHGLVGRKDISMRAARWMAILVLGLAGLARGQDSAKPQNWQKMYEDASAQLRAAQDRKSELAAQNAKLTAHVAELEKGLQASQDEFAVLRSQSETFAEATYLLHSFY